MPVTEGRAARLELAAVALTGAGCLLSVQARWLGLIASGEAGETAGAGPATRDIPVLMASYRSGPTTRSPASPSGPTTTSPSPTSSMS